MSILNAAKDVVNASMPLPWLLVSGQPTESQLDELHAAGLGTVVDLREAMEPRPFDEPERTRALGMKYVNAPVVSGALTDKAMDEALAALRAAKGTPTMLHCNSANRTGGPLIALLMIDEKMDEGSAVDTAMRSGLRSAEVMEWATDYVRRKR
jgi:protein tyrosine phosphatase (PTP) superfamily phosphohydrolase (DUF442 family)